MESDAILFLDTETTGLPREDGPDDGGGQPRLVQLAAILAAGPAGSPRANAEFSCLIEPDGWEIEPGAQAIHGLTTEDCRLHGLKQWHALTALSALASRAGLLVAHNVEFDLGVLKNEYRITLGYDLWIGKKKSFCTMCAAAEHTRVPPYRNGQWRWPKLAVAYSHFTGRDLEHAHDALADCRACMAIYYAIQRRANSGDFGPFGVPTTLPSEGSSDPRPVPL